MMKSLLLRDADCGALAILPTNEGVATIDHGYSDYDYSIVLEVLESIARPASQGNGILAWTSDTPSRRVIQMVESKMREKGYSEDKHGAQAIMHVTEEEAGNPPCPFSRRIERFHESLEKGLQKDIAGVYAVAESLGDYRELTTRFHAQRRKGDLGESIPFVRITGVLRNPVDTIEEVRKALMGTLPAECLTKASVEQIDEGYLVDIGYAPTAEMCQQHVISCVPKFDPSKVRGSRSVKFVLQTPLSENSARRLEESALSCGAANSVNFPNGYTVVARSGSSYEGDALRDDAFGDRLDWLFEQLEEWGPAIERTGDHEPLVAG